MARRRTLKQMLDDLVARFVPELRTAFQVSIDNVVDNVIIKDLIRAIQDGDLELAFRRLGFSNAAMRPLTAMIERLFEEGGVIVGDSFPHFSGNTVYRFDVRNSRAEAWLRDHSSELVTRIQDGTREALRNVVSEGMRAGNNPRNIALDIVGRVDPTSGRRMGGIVGLTPQQERWAANARRELGALDANYFTRERRDKRFDRIVQRHISNGTPIPTETVNKLITRYKDGLLLYRGETIARTEAIHSLNQSEWEAHKQLVETGAIRQSAIQRHWDSAGDKRVRWSHSQMDKKYEAVGVGLDEPFVSPTGSRMMFPGDTSLGAPADEVVMCRCRVRIKADWLADLD